MCHQVLQSDFFPRFSKFVKKNLFPVCHVEAFGKNNTTPPPLATTTTTDPFYLRKVLSNECSWVIAILFNFILHITMLRTINF